MKIVLPYGTQGLACRLPKERVQCVLESKLQAYRPCAAPGTLVREALDNPIAALPLCELARGRRKAVIIASDHTRPVPSKLLMPPILAEIRRGNPDADITILIATGCHRGMTRREITAKFGPEIAENETIVVHDCALTNPVDLGTLPSGGRCLVNPLVAEADLLLSEGFIEPHFFAGFSGGRKSVLPGIASRETVLYNHCAEFIAHPNARAGILTGNPIHEDMLWAAGKANLAFIVNVILNADKEVVHVVAGDAAAAHETGCAFLMRYCGVKAPPADIVIATNGGYPLDQNIYQAAKGICTAEAAVKPGGVIIMLARSEDGHGGEHYYRQFKENQNLAALMERLMACAKSMTQPDQWQTQIQIRALQKASVVYVSEADEQLVQDMHMIPAKTVEEALRVADAILGHDHGTITVIPDAVSVIFTQD